MKKLIINTFGILALALTLQSCEKSDEVSNNELPSSLVSFELLRSMQNGADVPQDKEIVLDDFRINGVIVADPSTKNLPEDYLAIQQSWNGSLRGMILKMDKQEIKNYQIGDSLIIDIQGKILSKKEGPIMISGISSKDINKVKTGIKVAPKRVSVEILNTQFDSFESTLVTIEANISPSPGLGEKLAGNKQITDDTPGTFSLYTESEAVFADDALPVNATFTGIPFRDQTKAAQLRLRESTDIQNGSGPIYQGWPETFDSPVNTTKSSYNMPAINNTITLKTGSWQLFQSILGNTAGRDQIVSGGQAIRFQQELSVPAYLQMEFDVPNGATKVSVWYGSYYNDASSTWFLESSTDQGSTWQQVGEPVSNGAPSVFGAKLATFKVDINGPVRFRINKIGLGPTLLPAIQNGRLGMDDFAIFQQY